MHDYFSLRKMFMECDIDEELRLRVDFQKISVL